MWYSSRRNQKKQCRGSGAFVALVHLRKSPVFAEVIPSKMFEAMGMGLPLLLALPDGEASAILQADGAGLWVPPEDAAALADSALRLCKEGTLRQEFARNSLAAAPRHSRETQARHMIDVLEAAAAGQGGWPHSTAVVPLT